MKALTIDAIWINPASNKNFLPNALWLLKNQIICQIYCIVVCVYLHKHQQTWQEVDLGIFRNIENVDVDVTIFKI